jgi:hypothetical protein
VSAKRQVEVGKPLKQLLLVHALSAGAA